MGEKKVATQGAFCRASREGDQRKFCGHKNTTTHFRKGIKKDMRPRKEWDIVKGDKNGDWPAKTSVKMILC